MKPFQLTVAGCLGPCDLVNVVTIVTPGEVIWLGGLTESHFFEALVDWAEACVWRSEILPLPPVLDAQRFDRFPGSRVPVPVAERAADAGEGAA